MGDFERAIVASIVSHAQLELRPVTEYRNVPLKDTAKVGEILLQQLKSPALFLERYGKLLPLNCLPYFYRFRDSSFEVKHYLDLLTAGLPKPPELPSDEKTTVRNWRKAQRAHANIDARTHNRRWRYLQQHLSQTNYFDEDQMAAREPDLYHQYIGQFSTGGFNNIPAAAPAAAAPATGAAREEDDVEMGTEGSSGSAKSSSAASSSAFSSASASAASGSSGDSKQADIDYFSADLSAFEPQKRPLGMKSAGAAAESAQMERLKARQFSRVPRLQPSDGSSSSSDPRLHSFAGVSGTIDPRCGLSAEHTLPIRRLAGEGPQFRPAPTSAAAEQSSATSSDSSSAGSAGSSVGAGSSGSGSSSAAAGDRKQFSVGDISKLTTPPAESSSRDYRLSDLILKKYDAQQARKARILAERRAQSQQPGESHSSSSASASSSSAASSAKPKAKQKKAPKTEQDRLSDDESELESDEEDASMRPAPGSSAGDSKARSREDEQMDLDDDFDYDDEDDEGDEEGAKLWQLPKPVAIDPESQRELADEFLRVMQERFLAGKDSAAIDYSKIDTNPDLDDDDERRREDEDAWFSKDED